MVYDFGKNEPRVVMNLSEKIAQIMDGDKPLTIMEVCGTHTMSVFRYDLKTLLPANLNLLSGPGCPVCVTPPEWISLAVKMSKEPNVLICTFGDMMRVPCAAGSLQEAKEQGANIQIVFSSLVALRLAQKNPQLKVIFLAVGFETTAPTTATVLQMARDLKVSNFRILSLHKTMPRALFQLLDGNKKVDALLCPGHVAAVTGSDYFKFVSQQLHKSAVVAGFETVDIMQGIYQLVKQVQEGRQELENAYTRCVTAKGNTYAMDVMNQVFEPVDSVWRGLGLIEKSGLALRKEWADFDACNLFNLELVSEVEPEDCRCGEVLGGECLPTECPLFAGGCTPESPVGACMVSGEGVCAAYYKYR